MSSNTVNTIQKITPDATHIGDSRITDDGTDVTVASDKFQVGDYATTSLNFLAFRRLAGDSTTLDTILTSPDENSFVEITAFAANAQTANIQLIADTSTLAINGSTTNTISLKASNGIAQSAPASTTAGILANGQVSMWLDQVGNKLKFAVKYSDGTTKSCEIALT